MASSRDRNGRPVVVVTGMGVITSLGAGKADNWAKLTAGRIRHPPHHPLSERRSQDHASPALSTSCRSSRSARPSSASAWRRWSPKRRSPRPASGAKAISPVRCFSRSRRSRSSGRIAMHWRPRRAPTTWSDTTISCARAPPAASVPFTNAACSARSPSISPTVSAPRARRSRCRPPAHRAQARSSSASRRSGAAKPRPRCASAPTARSIRKP